MKKTINWICCTILNKDNKNTTNLQQEKTRAKMATAIIKGINTTKIAIKIWKTYTYICTIYTNI